MILRSLSPAPDLPTGLQRLIAALETVSTGVDELVRIQQPLSTRVDALDLPAGFATGSLDPLMLLGPDWSGAGVTLQHDAETPAGLPVPPPGLRLALSCRFDPQRPAGPDWEPFGRCRAWLPTFELDAERSLLALNWRPGMDRAALDRAVNRWRQPSTSGDTPLAVSWQDDTTDRARWHQAVKAALTRIADTDTLPLLRKIVLARPQPGVLQQTVHPTTLLRAHPTGTVGWPWWLQHGHQAWLGETPELLGHRQDSTLRTLALAGTRPRHHDARRDQDLGQELLQSDKDRREQATVADWLRGQLTALAGTPPEVGELELRRLPSLQHLSRSLSVTSTDLPADAAWIDALHPTPALCGAPRADVRAWLRETEGFDRGLYGGVLGWVESDRAVAQVAIRGAMLTDQRRITVIAGAGLVRGSDPAHEWAETRAKVNAVCRRLGLVPLEDSSS